ncbi:MAG: DeoR family transcriptional regulator, partial [Odoribacteraceae bacterium]|nr:DeoR family transcriptional regulator [Odoribacteraceae bacterium]
QYEKAFLYAENDDNDLNYFIIYHLRAMQKAFEALKDYIKLKQQESIQTAQFVKIQGINERQAYLLKKLYDEPEIVFTVKDIKNRFDISDFTARADLQHLVDLGLMSAIHVNQVKKNYVRPDGFEALLKRYREQYSS